MGSSNAGLRHIKKLPALLNKTGSLIFFYKLAMRDLVFTKQAP